MLSLSKGIYSRLIHNRQKNGNNPTAHQQKKGYELPWCPVVKNPPFNARNMVLISGRRNKILHALGQLSTTMKTQYSQNRKTNNLNCFKNRRMGKMYYINRRVQSKKGKMYCSHNYGFISQVQF